MTFMLSEGSALAAGASAQQDAIVIVGVVNFCDERVELNRLENDVDAELLANPTAISTAVFSRAPLPVLVLRTNSILLPSASVKKSSPLRFSIPISFNSSSALAGS